MRPADRRRSRSRRPACRVRFEVSKVARRDRAAALHRPGAGPGRARPGRGGPLRRPRRRPPGQPAAPRAWSSTRSAGSVAEENVAGVRGGRPRAALRPRPDLQRAHGGAPLGRRRPGRGAAASPSDRVLEVAELLGLPVLSRQRVRAVARPVRLAGRPSRAGCSPRWPATAGAALVARVGRGEPGRRRAARRPVRAGCCARRVALPGAGLRQPFGADARAAGPVAQPPPTLRGGAPICPRHDDAAAATPGPRPRGRGPVGTGRRRGPPAVRGGRRPAGGGRPGAGRPAQAPAC